MSRLSNALSIRNLFLASTVVLASCGTAEKPYTWPGQPLAQPVDAISTSSCGPRTPAQSISRPLFCLPANIYGPR